MPGLLPVVLIQRTWVRWRKCSLTTSKGETEAQRRKSSLEEASWRKQQEW